METVSPINPKMISWILNPSTPDYPSTRLMLKIMTTLLILPTTMTLWELLIIPQATTVAVLLGSLQWMEFHVSIRTQPLWTKPWITLHTRMIPLICRADSTSSRQLRLPHSTLAIRNKIWTTAINSNRAWFHRSNQVSRTTTKALMTTSSNSQTQWMTSAALKLSHSC